MWSIKHKQCFKCGTKSVPHSGHGFCKKCYSKWIAIEKKDTLLENKRRYKSRNRLIVLSKENKRSRKSKTRSEYTKTNVYKGMKAEKEAVKILTGSKRVNKRFKAEQPFDVMWDGKRVNVKSSRLANYKFSFGLAGTQVNCDYLFCMGYIGDKLSKCWLIPSNVFPATKNSVAFGHKSSKFDKYLFHQNAPPSIPVSIEANSTETS